MSASLEKIFKDSFMIYSFLLRNERAVVSGDITISFISPDKFHL
jgi:hypothetical protein